MMTSAKNFEYEYLMQTFPKCTNIPEVISKLKHVHM